MIVCVEAINEDVPANEASKEVVVDAVPSNQSPLGQSAGDLAPISAVVPSVLDGQVSSKEDLAQPNASNAESLGDSHTCSIIFSLVFNLCV